MASMVPWYRGIPMFAIRHMQMHFRARAPASCKLISCTELLFQRKITEWHISWLVSVNLCKRYKKQEIYQQPSPPDIFFGVNPHKIVSEHFFIHKTGVCLSKFINKCVMITWWRFLHTDFHCRLTWNIKALQGRKCVQVSILYECIRRCISFSKDCHKHTISVICGY